MTVLVLELTNRPLHRRIERPMNQKIERPGHFFAPEAIRMRPAVRSGPGLARITLTGQAILGIDPLGYPHADTTYYREPTRHSAFLRPRRAIHPTEEGRRKSTAD